MAAAVWFGIEAWPGGLVYAAMWSGTAIAVGGLIARARLRALRQTAEQRDRALVEPEPIGPATIRGSADEEESR